MHRTFQKVMVLVSLFPLVVVGIGGCSDSSAECKLKYTREVSPAVHGFEIVVNPPGESGDFAQDEEVTRSRRIGREPGEDFVSISEYEVNIVRTYRESGNTYEIVAHVKFDDSDDRSKLIGYDITVTGGVYGATPHTCAK